MAGRRPSCGRSMPGSRWLVLLWAGAAAGALPGRKQLSPTVVVTSLGDLEGTSPGSILPACQLTAQNARRFSTAVSFAITVYAMTVDKESVQSFALKDAQGKLLPAANDSVSRWRRGLAACLSFAAGQGFELVHVLGHVDPLHPVLLRPTTWRNLLMFAPQEKADGWSYADVLVTPTLEALVTAARPSIELWFSVSGEMGLSNFVAADQWLDVLTSARSQLRKQRWKAVKVATALNWDMACGCVDPADPVPGSFDPIAYNRTYAAEFGKIRQFTTPYAASFKTLLEDNDFIGVSGYGAGYPTRGVMWHDIELPLYTLAHELGFLGVSLGGLSKCKPVIFVEQGLGGVLRFGIEPAPDLGVVVKYPSSGSWPETYGKEIDPWKRSDFRDYRRAFYKATLDMLQRPPGGQQYRLDGVFVWSVGSFDVFGVHPGTSNAGGSFADPEIVAAVKCSNGVGR